MDEVAPGLWVGDARFERRESRELRERGAKRPVRDAAAAARADAVDTVVRLLHEPPEADYPDGVQVLAHPLVDGPQCDAGDFADAVEAVRAARRRGETVLVHCSAGASRSPAVAATALAAEAGLELGDALVRVRDARATADPHPALLSLAQAYLERE